MLNRKMKVELGNGRDDSKASISADALVEPEAMHLCIPRQVAIQLGLKQIEQREVTIADGKKKVCAYVGPVIVRFACRACVTGALVLGEQIVMGTLPLLDMDLVINPANRAVVVNPDSPKIATSVAKGLY